MTVITYSPPLQLKKPHKSAVLKNLANSNTKTTQTALISQPHSACDGANGWKSQSDEGSTRT